MWQVRNVPLLEGQTVRLRSPWWTALELGVQLHLLRRRGVAKCVYHPLGGDHCFCTGYGLTSWARKEVVKSVACYGYVSHTHYHDWSELESRVRTIPVFLLLLWGFAVFHYMFHSTRTQPPAAQSPEAALLSFEVIQYASACLRDGD